MSIYQILADFARSVARDLDDLASRVSELGDEGEIPVELVETLPDPSDRALGPRQAQIVALPGLAEDDGMKTGDIAKAIQYDQPNTYTTLQALARQGLVELIPDKHPQHWRLTGKYRESASSQPYLRVASLIERGEWATYGDISVAVRGDTMGARAVGRAAATLPHFPNPHRVLQQGGVIPEGWRDSQGRGPEECRRRLEEEGVRFTTEARAEAMNRVTWDELLRRKNGNPEVGPG